MNTDTIGITVISEKNPWFTFETKDSQEQKKKTHSNEGVEEVWDDWSIRISLFKSVPFWIVMQPVEHVQLVTSIIFLGDLPSDRPQEGGGGKKKKKQKRNET